MKDLLHKLKLIEYLAIDIEIQKTEFVSKFRQLVDGDSLGIFSDISHLYSSSKNEFKGQVGYEGFKIEKRVKPFEKKNLAIANGTYRQNNEN